MPAIARGDGPCRREVSVFRGSRLLPDGVHASVQVQTTQRRASRRRVINEESLVVSGPVERCAYLHILDRNFFLWVSVYMKDLHFILPRRHVGDPSPIRSLTTSSPSATSYALNPSV